VPEKDVFFHVICTPHDPGTTNFRGDSIKMIIARGLQIASGFMVFDCTFEEKTRPTPGMSQTRERASGK
jgi:hypothetical protein